MTKATKYISIILLIGIISACLFGSSVLAYAEEVEQLEKFDETYVLNDLNGATIWGKTFNTSDYPKNDGGELRLLDFVEYSFSTKFELQYNYGLYLYVYNPKAIQFKDDDFNKVEIAIEYDSSGEPTKWDKFQITICSFSQDYLFYKFKIKSVGSIYDRIVTVPAQRRYDVVGIELRTPGNVNAHDYKIGGTWNYSGYAKGCHVSSENESTLSSTIKSLQTVDLDDLQFTVYRTWQTAELADQLTSVYFSVPKDIAKNYDELYSIQAETYQYLTAPIFCLYNTYIFGENGIYDYDKLFFELGLQRTLETPSTLGKDELSNILYWDLLDGAVTRKGAATGYNFTDSNVQNFVLLPKLMWLFQVSNKNEFRVSSRELLEYMQEWSFDDDINGKYDSDLFADKYYSYNMKYKTVTNGYLPIDINISGEDDFTLLGSDTKYNFWKKLFGSWDGTVGSSPIKPIEEVTSKDLKGLKDEEISKKYYVMLSDVSSFKNFVTEREKVGRITYIFHFAKSEYFTTDIYFDRVIYEHAGYMAQEVAYLDFDIISLGYRKGDVVNILPVVCSPIDIIGGVEPGTDPIDIGNKGLNLLAIILAGLIVIAIVYFAAKLLGAIFRKKRGK